MSNQNLAMDFNGQTAEIMAKLERVKNRQVLESLPQIWKKLGFKKSKSLNFVEFGSMINEILNLEPYTEVHSILFRMFDIDHNGMVDYAEMCTGIAALRQDDYKNFPKFLFQFLDINGDGLVSVEEFTTICKCLWGNKVCAAALNFAPDEKWIMGVEVFVNHVFQRADVNHDGYLSFEEFSAVMPRFMFPKFAPPLRVEHQTGGHIGSFAKGEGGTLLKKVSNPEFLFYKKLNDEFADWTTFAPRFFGFKEEDAKNWVIMEDLTFDMNRPCVMDIKMGTSSVGEDASPEKAQQMKLKDMQSTTHRYGLRITGMRVYNKITQDYTQHSKSWGRRLSTEHDICNGLIEFFHDEQKELRTNVVQYFLDSLAPFYEFMQSQSQIRIYSSSILFVYDAEPQKENPHLWRLIDFAHVHPIPPSNPPQHDDGYVFGLKNLLSYLSKIISA